MRFAGCYTAVLTPFRRGRVDEGAFRRLVRAQLRAGVAGLVPCGSTGEAATLTHEEAQRVVQLCVEESRGRAAVVAGIGTNDTAKAVDLAREAESWGADALLVLVPYYNKPTQGGIYLHLREVARAVRIPLVVYNIPGRTGVNMAPATLARLARDCPTVQAVKEASGSLDQVSEILALCPRGFTVLAGDDSLTLPMMAVGAKGVVSVVSNIAPRPAAELCRLALAGLFPEARRLHLKLFPLIKALFLETNPIPVKAAAQMLGLCSGEPRLPLTPITPENRKKLRLELARAGLLKK